MTWWNRLLRRGELEEQLDKELSFHIEQHTADLIAGGHDPGEARRHSRLGLGGPEQVKEQCRDARGTRWLEDLLQDVRYAVRTLRQRPGFAAVALVTLALGCGATTVMFTIINGVIVKPLPFPDPGKLVTLRERSERYGDQWGFAYLSFLDCKRESQSLDLAAWTYGGGTISGPGEAEYVDGRQISAELFPVLGVTPVRGRAFLPEEDQPGSAPVIVISYGLWRRRYDRIPGVVGMQIVFEGKPCTVVGVAPAGFQLGGDVDVFTPLGQNTEPRMQNRGAHIIHVVARVRPGSTLPQAESEMELIARRRAEQYPAFNEGRGIVLLALRDELVADVRPTLWLLLGAVGLVLLIACVNIASLLLARAVSRERELAMRVALGASRTRLVRQCLTESAVLGLCGGTLGLLLAAMGTRPFVTFWPGSLPRADEVGLDWHVLLVALAVSLVSGLLFGLAPALRAPARELEQTLRSGGRAVAGSSRRLHGSFVVCEVALAVVLLVSAGMLGRTLLHLSSLNPGLNVHNVLVTRLVLSPGAVSSAAQIRAAWQDVLDRARSVPGVQSAAMIDVVPMSEGEDILSYRATPDGPPPSQEPAAMASSVTPDYLKVMGIPLSQGRFFDDQDRLGNAPVVVIDEALAEHAFGGREAVGKRLWVPSLGSDPVQVVGVVGHVRHWGPAGDDLSPVRDQIYYPLAQVPDRPLHFFSSIMSMAVRTEVPPLNIVESLRREIRGAAGDRVLYDVRTMEQLASSSLARQRFLLLLFGIFGGLAMLLACIGIYGVLAYLTTQRVPEIGLRMALGASAGRVIWLVLRQSAGMILVGIGLGGSAAVGAGRILERLVQGMRPTEPATFAIMISVLIAAALLASFLPAHRASRVDAMNALRQE